MSKIVDARGLNCPEPAIRTGEALKKHEEITVIVDDESSVPNISKSVKKRGFEVVVEKKGKDFYLEIKKGGAEIIEKKEALIPSPSKGDIVALFSSDKVGHGNDELGEILTRAFIYSLIEVEPKPNTIIFMNSGVNLVIEGSVVLDDLKALEDAGVKILACGTCLGFFGLKDRVVIGEISNAYTLSETMMRASKVLKF